jgi:hypothetical protein
VRRKLSRMMPQKEEEEEEEEAVFAKSPTI